MERNTFLYLFFQNVHFALVLLVLQCKYLLWTTNVCANYHFGSEPRIVLFTEISTYYRGLDVLCCKSVP